MAAGAIPGALIFGAVKAPFVIARNVIGAGTAVAHATAHALTVANLTKSAFDLPVDLLLGGGLPFTPGWFRGTFDSLSYLSLLGIRALTIPPIAHQFIWNTADLLTGAAVSGLIGAPLGGLAGAGLGALAGAPIGAFVGAPIGALAGAPIGAAIGAPLVGIPSTVGGALTGAAVGTPVGAAIGSTIGAAITAPIGAFAGYLLSRILG